jgi:hypothetical protein
MKTLLEKEEKLISASIRELVYNILSNDFNLKSGKIITKVNKIQIGNIIVDSEKSEFKEEIFINSIEIIASITVQLTEHSYKDDAINLLPTDVIHLKYNNTRKGYNIVNTDSFSFVDLTN